MMVAQARTRVVWVYAEAIAAVAVATGLRILFEPILNGHRPVALIFGVVAYCIWRLGLGPAILAAILGFAANGLYMRSTDTVPLSRPEQILGVFIFGCTCAMIIGVGLALQRANRRLEVKSSQLGKSVEELRESEQRLRQAFAAVPMGNWEWDLRTNRVEWSPELEAIHGLNPGEFGGTVEDYAADIHPEDRERVFACVQEELKSGNEHQIEYRIVRPDGQIRWVEGRGCIERDAQGQAIRLRGVCTDVTPRKSAEAALRDNEARLSAILEQLPVGVGVLDRTGKLLVKNSRMSEYVAERVPSSDPETQNRWTAFDSDGQIVPPEQWPSARALQGAMSSLDSIYLHDDGREQWMRVRSTPFRNDEGDLVGAITVIEDVDAQKRAELSQQAIAQEQSTLFEFTSRLNRSESLAEVFDCAMDAIEAALECNRAALLLFDESNVMRFVAARGLSEGYKQAVEGHSPWTSEDSDPVAFGVDDVREAPLEEELRAVVLGEGIQSLAFVPLLVHRRLIGKLMVYYDEPHAFRREELNFATVIGHQIGFAIERAQIGQEMREADRRKDEFLATLAHELRNPLAPIRNGLELIAQSGEDHDVVMKTNRIMIRQVEHLSRLVDDLIDITRIKRGTLNLKVEVQDVRHVLENAAEMARSSMETAGHRFEIELPETPMMVKCDPQRMAQVFGNLLFNAFKFTPDRGWVQARAIMEGDQACVQISDSGIGIVAEDVGSVFELFSQVSDPLNHRPTGLGVGLALARQIVELHGGTIEAASQGRGKGSTFTVRLPAIDAAGARPKTEAPSGRELTGSRRILVVDDNRDAGETMAMLLKLEGHVVSFAQSGHEAVEICLREHPDVILMDLGMPEMDGYETAHRLRAMGASNGAAIVAVSGWGQPEDLKRTREAGFDAHLVKPASLESIRRILRQVEESTASVHLL